MNRDLVQVVGIVLGVALSLPVLVVLAKVAMFVGSIKTSSESTALTLKEFTSEMRQLLVNQDMRLAETEVKVAVLWDGRDRRTGNDRRTHE